MLPIRSRCSDGIPGPGAARTPMRLVDVRTLDGDTASLIYERVGATSVVRSSR
jgi:hypothetical protein